MDADSNSNFFHTAIKSGFPHAANIRTPRGCLPHKPIFLVDTRKRGPIICKFVDSRIAVRDKHLSERLVANGMPVPKIHLGGYLAQLYEVYNYNPKHTLAEHIKNHLDDDKIFETYKQVLDIQAKLAESSLDDIYPSTGKYFHEVYKISQTTARPKVLFDAIIKVISLYRNVRLVHCDLHPENIICNDDGSLNQIIDIAGIALASEEFAMLSLLDNFPLPDLSEELMDYYDKITHRKLDREFIRAGLKFRRLQKRVRNHKAFMTNKTK